MSTTEDKVERLETRFSTLEQQVSTIATKVDIFIEESKQQREDMRRLWERQDAERAQRDADMKAMQEKIDANQKEFTKQLHNNFVQTLLGVGAIMAAIGGLIISMIK